MTEATLELVEKTCTRCGETKPGSEFTRRRTARGWALQSRCKPCKATEVRGTQERRRAKLGDEEYQRVLRENQRRRRARDGSYDTAYRRARREAEAALIAAHPREFEELLRRAKYEAGLL